MDVSGILRDSLVFRRLAHTVSLDARAAGDQFAGRNIQMAAGSFAARTAKKSRSTCGTQSDVLAPVAVARCVTLTKPSACAANTSRNPSPQLT